MNISKFAKDNFYSIIVFAASIVFVCLLIAYRANFDGGLSEKREVWGQFGDFLGGTLNPILGFLTILILISTLKIQRMELKDAREAIKENSRLISSQLHTARQQSLELTFFRLLEDFEKDSYVLKAKKEDYSYNIYLACFRVKDIDGDSEELPTLFAELSNGLPLGQFRYVVVEKLATLVSLANQLENSKVLLKLLQTTAGLGLAASVVHHSMCLDLKMYNVFKSGKDLLRGLTDHWFFDDQLAKDFLSDSAFEKYLERKDETHANLEREVARYIEERRQFFEENVKDDLELDASELNELDILGDTKEEF